jgi:diacylglycerol kinase (ATP)
LAIPQPTHNGQTVHYAILANPCAGRMTVAQKRSALSAAAGLLKAPVHGLETRSRAEFIRCARELAEQCDVLVVAGGDGTVSDVINAIDTRCRPIAHIPLGTGNALRFALNSDALASRAAQRIKSGRIRTFDLIECDGALRAFMVSVGIESHILKRFASAHLRPHLAFMRYAYITLTAYFHTYKPPRVVFELDHHRLIEKKMLSLMVMKQPYYGFGMNVMPEARFDDGLLHVRCTGTNLIQTLWSVLTAFTIGNRAGKHFTGHNLAIQSDRPLCMQTDGNPGWCSDHFRLRVLPRGLKIKF